MTDYRKLMTARPVLTTEQRAELDRGFGGPAMTVITQDTGRTDREPRWAYVIRENGLAVYVSAYRYRTSEGAARAGQADAEACAAMEGELS